MEIKQLRLHGIPFYPKVALASIVNADGDASGIDSIVTEGSDNLITSGAVYIAVQDVIQQSIDDVDLSNYFTKDELTGGIQAYTDDSTIGLIMQAIGGGAAITSVYGLNVKDGEQASVLDRLTDLENSGLDPSFYYTKTEANERFATNSAMGTQVATLAGQIASLTQTVGGKQDTLVSGNNIKTINGSSILGSGDITISSGSTYTLPVADINTLGGCAVVKHNTQTPSIQSTTTTAGRYYGVENDQYGRLFVNVPWQAGEPGSGEANIVEGAIIKNDDGTESSVPVENKILQISLDINSVGNLQSTLDNIDSDISDLNTANNTNANNIVDINTSIDNVWTNLGGRPAEGAITTGQNIEDIRTVLGVNSSTNRVNGSNIITTDSINDADISDSSNAKDGLVPLVGDVKKYVTDKLGNSGASVNTVTRVVSDGTNSITVPEDASEQLATQLRYINTNSGNITTISGNITTISNALYNNNTLSTSDSSFQESFLYRVDEWGMAALGDYTSTTKATRDAVNQKGTVSARLDNVDAKVASVTNRIKSEPVNTTTKLEVSGSTSNRNTSAYANWVYTGFCYFDTTLNKPVWWTGSGWVDATGSGA